MQALKQHIVELYEAQLAAYAQIFFSHSKLLAWLLMIVSFMDLYAGFAGFLAVLVSNMLAKVMGYSELQLREGIFAFNSLLTGLGTGLFFQPSWELYLIVIMLAVLTFFLTVTLQAWLGKYGLPFLSIPFLFGIWIVLLAAGQFKDIGISGRGIYIANEIYALGGKTMFDLYNFAANLPLPSSLRIYLLSLGAIFFQYNILAGWIIAIGLLITSRISFTLSLLGFYTAYWFYFITGADIHSLQYSYIGFNFILTSIAIGGFFLIPSRMSYLWSIVLLPIVVLITVGTMEVFEHFSLSIYSLPFNLVVLLFLYALKLRVRAGKELIEPRLQLYSPENNLYFFNNAKERFKELEFFPVRLPFWGEWTISQGHNGEYTHRENWKHAWDFVIEDENGQQYRNSGKNPGDYYTYEKNVIAPADGIIVDLTDGIPDNAVGEVNTLQNWGNSIVIKHTEYLYSQLSHLKANTLKVRKGDFVRQGDILGQVGNSGRSPVPHLHFQLQASPYTGSPTIDYPLSHYIARKNDKYRFCTFEKPLKGEFVSNVKTHPILERLLKFTPGEKLRFVYLKNGIKQKITWEIGVDAFNQTYFYDEDSHSLAYFYNDGLIHYFKNFTGDKTSILFHFYKGLYRIQAGYYRDMSLEDELPVHHTFFTWRKFLQDWVAPFYRFLKTKYYLTYDKSDDELFPSEISFHSEIIRYCGKKILNKTTYLFEADERGLKSFSFSMNGENIILKREQL